MSENIENIQVEEVEAAIEAMLFASGDPVEVETFAELFDISVKDMIIILDNMAVNYQNRTCGIMLKKLENRYSLCTKPEYSDYIQNLMSPPRKHALSQAALETLAIVAYNQPVTRAKIEEIRGVNSDSSVLRLVERNLIEECGVLEVIGRPKLYRTTELFLKLFNFSSLEDLPELELEEKDREILANLEREESETEDITEQSDT